MSEGSGESLHVVGVVVGEDHEVEVPDIEPSQATVHGRGSRPGVEQQGTIRPAADDGGGPLPDVALHHGPPRRNTPTGPPSPATGEQDADRPAGGGGHHERGQDGEGSSA